MPGTHQEATDSSSHQYARTIANHMIIQATGVCTLTGLSAISRRNVGKPFPNIVTHTSRQATKHQKQALHKFNQASQAKSSWLNRTSKKTKGRDKVGSLIDNALNQSGTHAENFQKRLMSDLPLQTNDTISWTQWFSRLGIGLATMTGVGAYGFTFHTENSNVRANLKEQCDLSAKIKHLIILSYTGFCGRIGETDSGFNMLSSLNELILRYTSPLLSFKKNKLPNGKRLALFRGESHQEALDIISGKSRVNSFYAFWKKQFTLPRVFHAGMEAPIENSSQSHNESDPDNLGGFSQGVTSLSVDFKVALTFGNKYQEEEGLGYDRQTIMICAPKCFASTASHQTKEGTTQEREVITTGLRSQDVLGYLRVCSYEQDIIYIDFKYNQNFKGNLDDIQFDASMLEYIEQIPDDNPYKTKLLSLVNSDVNHSEKFDKAMPPTMQSSSLTAEKLITDVSQKGLLDSMLYRFFGSRAMNQKIHHVANTPEGRKEQKIFKSYEKLQHEETPEHICHFRDNEGNLFERVSRPLGSNLGGFFKNQNGDEYYIKYRSELDHDAEKIFRSEHLATKLYHLFHLKTPEVSRVHFMKDGHVYCGIKSKFRKGLISYHGKSDIFYGINWKKDKTFFHRATKGALVDIWLGNYDVIGLEFDNLHATIDETTGELEPFRLDTGAALGFRAQGARDYNFNASASDFDAYFDTYASTFGHCFNELKTNPQLLDSAIKVLSSVSNNQIRQAVKQNNPCLEIRDTYKLSKMLIKRRAALLTKAQEHLESLQTNSTKKII